MSWSSTSANNNAVAVHSLFPDHRVVLLIVDFIQLFAIVLIFLQIDVNYYPLVPVSPFDNGQGNFVETRSQLESIIV